MPGPPMLQGPFRVPSFNGYIPRRLQPWIYLLFAFIFQMSGGIYGGAMSQVMGEYSLMREDVLMIVMFNVVGVAMPFPFLFKMKFHFTNRQLLLNAALVIAACNFLIMWTDSVPVMCILSYLAGFFKLCGTFECMSNIQLWMTPKRDFTIFFPLLILFAFVEFMGSTPKVLQTAFTGGVLHFGTFTTNVLNFVEWVGSIAGCLFCLFWCKVLHQKYTRLLTIGVATMVCYPVMMYFLIDPGLNIEALYLPLFLRSIGNAIFFCMLTVYLEELMPFEHFFMGLTMAGIIRNGPVSAMCSGLYSYGLRHQMAENMSRGLPYDAGNLLMISIRELYGLTCLIGIGVLIIFLLWDIQPIRSTLKKMPAWNFVGRKIKKNLA